MKNILKLLGFAGKGPEFIEFAVMLFSEQGVNATRRAFTVPEERARKIARDRGANEDAVVKAFRELGEAAGNVVRALLTKGE